MQREDFQIGQRVHFTGFTENDSILGTVVDITEHSIQFKWDTREAGKTKYSNRFKQDSTFSRMTLVDQEQEKDHKQLRINQRIKKLWNNSNWVRNNPAQAY